MKFIRVLLILGVMLAITSPTVGLADIKQHVFSISGDNEEVGTGSVSSPI